MVQLIQALSVVVLHFLDDERIQLTETNFRFVNLAQMELNLQLKPMNTDNDEIQQC